MNNTQIQGLEYVRNTNGGGTLIGFLEDFYPVGALVWDDLEAEGLVLEGINGGIHLTPKGRDALQSTGGCKCLRSR